MYFISKILTYNLQSYNFTTKVSFIIITLYLRFHPKCQILLFIYLSINNYSKILKIYIISKKT